VQHSTGPQGEGERELLAAIRAGDAAALDVLYRGHASLVHGLATRILQDDAAAEEVTQDVFLYVWQQIERYDPRRGNLASWLVTLTRSRSIDRLRARASRVRRVEGLARDAAAQPVPAVDPLLDLVLAERRGRVRRALETLSDEQRRALEIAYFEGLSHSEIAARLGAPLGTVKTRIRQGMIRLREALDEPLR
jgi:RNA polymerase sigma-70 factor (ECF subfamily)